jgi:hypothetical protein
MQFLEYFTVSIRLFSSETYPQISFACLLLMLKTAIDTHTKTGAKIIVLNILI